MLVYKKVQDQLNSQCKQYVSIISKSQLFKTCIFICICFMKFKTENLNINHD